MCRLMIFTCQFSATYPVNFSPSPAFYIILGNAVAALKRVNWRRVEKPKQFKHNYFWVQKTYKG